MLAFSENEHKWQQIPRWAYFLIRFGFQWDFNVSEQRRIALFSMPCDSAAASLIALGALISDLGNPEANDISGHYNSLLRYARQYLEQCSNCNHPCHPKKMRCGHTAKATGWVRNWRERPVQRYKISGRTNLTEKSLWYSYKGGVRWQNPKLSIDWQIDGEPPPQLNDHEGVLDEEIYTHIIDSAQIFPDNLRKSFSGLCLAGRVGGKTVTHNVSASVRFRINEVEYSLPELLTVHGWSNPGSVSRMSFFNSRTERFDRNTSAISLVVVDGDKSFIRVLGRSEFQRTDVIGVISRVLARDDLEAVGNRIQGLRQWYTDDEDSLHRFSFVPRGIGVKIIKRRGN
jgi:hypothetical protein